MGDRAFSIEINPFFCSQEKWPKRHNSGADKVDLRGFLSRLRRDEIKIATKPYQNPFSILGTLCLCGFCLCGFVAKKTLPQAKQNPRKSALSASSALLLISLWQKKSAHRRRRLANQFLPFPKHKTSSRPHFPPIFPQRHFVRKHPIKTYPPITYNQKPKITAS